MKTNKKRGSQYGANQSLGFTLVELMVSMAVLAILMAIVASVIGTVQRSWRSTNAKVAQFREARRSFDILKRNLNQATLNTYLRFRFTGSADAYSPYVTDGTVTEEATPSSYEPFSELQFVCGPTETLVPGGGPYGHAVFFQAILGYSGIYPNLPTTLNGRGYYVEFGDDEAFRPPFVTGRVRQRWRYRLMEYAPPTERNSIYDLSSRESRGDWFADVATWSRPIADNVVALYFSPKRPDSDGTGDPRDIAPNYSYDSTLPSVRYGSAKPAHELPPQMEIIMVVIDEASASRKMGKQTDAPFQFTGFTTASKASYESDLAKIEEELLDEKVNYRIFSSTVTLSNSKWRGEVAR